MRSPRNTRVMGKEKGEMEAPVDRYHRQNLVPGWEQDKLAAGTINILGEGPLVAAIATGAYALGIGSVGHVFLGKAGQELLGPPLDWTLRLTDNEPQLRASMVNYLYTLNPMVTAVKPDWEPDGKAAVVCINSPGNKLDGVEPGDDTLLVEVSTTKRGGMLRVLPFKDLDKTWMPMPYIGVLEPADADVACVLGGLVLGEVRSHLAPLDIMDEPTDRILRYHASHPDRLVAMAPGDPDPFLGIEQSNPYLKTPHAKAILVGAGAIGTWFALGLVGTDWIEHLTVVDPDTVSETNLNRQVLYADAVGKDKATTLSEKLRAMVPGMEITSLVDSLDKEKAAELLVNSDAIITAVDSFEARANVHKAALEAQKILVNSGSGPLAAKAMAYLPGVTSCLDCQSNVIDLAAKEKGERGRCVQRHEASTVIGNMIAGGWSVAELRASLLGTPTGGNLTYDGSNPYRIGLLGSKPACSCKGDAK